MKWISEMAIRNVTFLVQQMWLLSSILMPILRGCQYSISRRTLLQIHAKCNWSCWMDIAEKWLLKKRRICGKSSDFLAMIRCWKSLQWKQTNVAVECEMSMVLLISNLLLEFSSCGVCPTKGPQLITDWFAYCPYFLIQINDWGIEVLVTYWIKIINLN